MLHYQDPAFNNLQEKEIQTSLCMNAKRFVSISIDQFFLILVFHLKEEHE